MTLANLIADKTLPTGATLGADYTFEIALVIFALLLLFALIQSCRAAYWRGRYLELCQVSEAEIEAFRSADGDRMQSHVNRIASLNMEKEYLQAELSNCYGAFRAAFKTQTTPPEK